MPVSPVLRRLRCEDCRESEARWSHRVNPKSPWARVTPVSKNKILKNAHEEWKEKGNKTREKRGREERGRKEGREGEEERSACLGL